MPVAAGLAALTAFVLLAPAATGGGDSGELTLALALGGVPHPTGYPLYVLLGHPFVRALHALGAGWGHAANLWSALGGAIAVGLAAALARRLAPGAGAAMAAVAAAWLALHPLTLGEATQAEVTTLHLAWVAGAGLATLALLRRAADPRAAGGWPARAAGWGALCGVGLAHHLTALFFVVPLSLALAVTLARARRLGARAVAAAAAGLLAPLAAYGWVAWRAWHPAAHQWPLLEPSWSSVWAHVTGRVFRVYIGGYAPTPDQAALLDRWVWPPGLAGLVATAALAWRSPDRVARAAGLALVVGAALELGFVRLYGVPDPAPYVLPPLLVALLALPLAAVVLAPRVRPAAAALVAALPLLVLAPGVMTHALAERRRLEAVEARIHDAWRAIPFERGFVFWDGDFYTRLRGYQILEHEHPALAVDNPSMLSWPWPRAAFRRRWGIDPLAGLELRAPEDLARVPANVARQTPLPVIEFTGWADRLAARRRARGSVAP